MRVQIGSAVFGTDANPAVYLNEDDRWCVATVEVEIPIEDEHVDAFGHWVELGCPLPVAGEYVFEGYRMAFDVTNWYLEQQRKD